MNSLKRSITRKNNKDTMEPNESHPDWKEEYEKKHSALRQASEERRFTHYKESSSWALVGSQHSGASSVSPLPRDDIAEVEEECAIIEIAREPRGRMAGQPSKAILHDSILLTNALKDDYNKKEEKCWSKVAISLIVLGVLLLPGFLTGIIPLVLGCYSKEYVDRNIKKAKDFAYGGFVFLLGALVVNGMFYYYIFEYVRDTKEDLIKPAEETDE